MAMSLRSRGAAAAGRRQRAGARPIYEDFKPMFEWKHEDEVDIILYHLPGYVKEQIRIIAESKGVLRVRGERLVTGNKWSRFQEEFVVPEDCILSGIRAKFEDGVLRVIMPKIKKIENKTQIIDNEANKVREPTSSSSVTKPTMDQKPQLSKEDIPSSSTLPSNIGKPRITSFTPLPLAPREGGIEPKTNKLHELISSLKPSMGTRNAGTKEGNSPQQHDHEGHKMNQEGTISNIDPKDVGHSGTSPSRNKNDESKQSHEESRPKVPETQKMQAGILNRVSDESKESHEESRPKAPEKQKMHAEILNRESDNGNKFDQGYGHLNQKNLTKGHFKRSLDQDRQLLVNMGAAILVIMALGASISYTLGFSDQF